MFPRYGRLFTKQFSQSVRNVADRLQSLTEVTSWQIVVELCQLHPEYGDRLAEKLISEQPRGEQQTKTLVEWLSEAQHSVENPAPDGIIDGRRLILALARIDKNLNQFLSDRSFLQPLEWEVQTVEPAQKEPPPQPTPTTEPTPPPLTPDSTHLHADNPAAADKDKLGRESFAKLLAKRLEILWKENISDQSGNSFVLHLHGPWGSGKSSLLNLLRHELQFKQAETRWIVVDFNAWQNQRINPPWWPLLDRIYRESIKQLRDTFSEPKLARDIRRFEFLWRFWTANIERFVLAGILIVLTLVICFAIYFWGAPFFSNVLKIPASTGNVEAASKSVAIVTGGRSDYWDLNFF